MKGICVCKRIWFHSFWVMHSSSNKIKPNCNTLLGSLSDHSANGLCFDLWCVYACFQLVSTWNQCIAKSKSNCPEMWPGLGRKVIKSLQVLWTDLTSKLLIELKARQFYFINLTSKFCNETTQLHSLPPFLEFVFVKDGLNIFTTHHTMTWFLEHHSKICQMWSVVLIVVWYNLLLK